MRIVAFDGDHTLWEPLDGLCISDRTPTDSEGRADFAFTRSQSNPLLVARDDGARFAMRPETRAVLSSLRQAGLAVAVVSYNHPGNIRSALAAWGILDLCDYVRAEWHTRKDTMIAGLLFEASASFPGVTASDVMLVDDDPEGLYRQQCLESGTRLVKFGVDVSDLREVVALALEAEREVGG